MSLLSSAQLLEKYPHISQDIRNIVSSVKTITLLNGGLNHVFNIDSQYILRTQKIKLKPFDDIGSCANFAVTTTYLKKNGFHYCPSDTILETTTNSDGKKTDLLIYPFKEGNDLSTLQSQSPEGQIKVAKQIAYVFAHLHRISAPQCGFFVGQRFNNPYALISYWLNNQTIYIRKFKLLDEETIKQVMQIFRVNSPILTNVTPSVIHLDLNQSNILLDKKGSISQIIDWDNARGGDPAFDLSYSLERPFRAMSTVFKKTMLKTYLAQRHIADTSIFMRRYYLYTLFMAYKLLPVHFNRNDVQGENVAELKKDIKKILLMKW